jgi:hypothetical protein
MAWHGPAAGDGVRRREPRSPEAVKGLQEDVFPGLVVRCGATPLECPGTTAPGRLSRLTVRYRGRRRCAGTGESGQSRTGRSGHFQPYRLATQSSRSIVELGSLHGGAVTRTGLRIRTTAMQRTILRLPKLLQCSGHGPAGLSLLSFGVYEKLLSDVLSRSLQPPRGSS